MTLTYDPSAQRASYKLRLVTVGQGSPSYDPIRVFFFLATVTLTLVPTPPRVINAFLVTQASLTPKLVTLGPRKLQILTQNPFFCIVTVTLTFVAITPRANPTFVII